MSIQSLYRAGIFFRTLWRSFVHARKTAVMTKLILEGFGFLGKTDPNASL